MISPHNGSWRTRSSLLYLLRVPSESQNIGLEALISPLPAYFVEATWASWSSILIFSAATHAHSPDIVMPIAARIITTSHDNSETLSSDAYFLRNIVTSYADPAAIADYTYPGNQAPDQDMAVWYAHPLRPPPFSFPYSSSFLTRPSSLHLPSHVD